MATIQEQMQQRRKDAFKRYAELLGRQRTSDETGELIRLSQELRRDVEADARVVAEAAQLKSQAGAHSELVERCRKLDAAVLEAGEVRQKEIAAAHAKFQKINAEANAVHTQLNHAGGVRSEFGLLVNAHPELLAHLR